MIGGTERLAAVADELGAIQVGGDRRMQPAIEDELVQSGKSIDQCVKRFAQGTSLEIDVCDAGSLPRNAKELDPHDDRYMMIAFTVHALLHE